MRGLVTEVLGKPQPPGGGEQPGAEASAGKKRGWGGGGQGPGLTADPPRRRVKGSALLHTHCRKTPGTHESILFF